MKLYAGVDVSHFSRFNPGSQAPLWWGIIGLLLIEGTVILLFITSYFYLRMGAEAWPPAGVELPPIFWSTVNLILLLLSSVSMLWAGWGINRNNQTVLVAGTAICILLASLVLVFRTYELQALNFRWDSHPYGSIVWTMFGFHFVHVASIIVGTAVICLLGWIGYFHKERQIGVIVDTIYWNFVALAWIPLYLVLVWSPRFL